MTKKKKLATTEEIRDGKADFNPVDGIFTVSNDYSVTTYQSISDYLKVPENVINAPTPEFIRNYFAECSKTVSDHKNSSTQAINNAKTILSNMLINCKRVVFIDCPGVQLDDAGQLVNYKLADAESSISEEYLTKTHMIHSPLSLYEIKADTIFIHIEGVIIPVASDGPNCPDFFYLNYVTTNTDKKKATFTISEKVLGRFNVLADRLAINKSKFIENRLKEFIDANRI